LVDDEKERRRTKKNEETHTLLTFHQRVFFFHAHAYFDHSIEAHQKAAREFHESISTFFSSEPEVEVHTFQERPIGPHPFGNFETLFTKNTFTKFVTWLMWNRPEEVFGILIHPISQVQVPDHVYRPLWVGKQIPLIQGVLFHADAATAAKNQTEEEAILSIIKH